MSMVLILGLCKRSCAVVLHPATSVQARLSVVSTRMKEARRMQTSARCTGTCGWRGCKAQQILNVSPNPRFCGFYVRIACLERTKRAMGHAMVRRGRSKRAGQGRTDMMTELVLNQELDGDRR